MDDVLLARGAIWRWFDAGVEAVEPRRVVAETLVLQGDDLRIEDQTVLLSPTGRVIVFAIGKAAVSMAQGAVDVLGNRIDSGTILTKHGHLSHPVTGFAHFEAGHPVPDENSLVATNAILAEVDGLTGDDLVIALVSGGGSALLELPVDGVSLEDMRTTTRTLMQAGAGIHDLNAVRKTLSRVKGGGLRRAIGPARCVSLLLSDVLGNDPSVIAGGPTVVTSGDAGAAHQVIERFGIGSDLPHSVMHAMTRTREDGTEVDAHRDVVSVVADNDTFVQAIVRRAAADGFSVRHDAEPYRGDANELGQDFVRIANEASDKTDVIVRGGEATVKVVGHGMGGRNTEMALSAAIAMSGNDAWVISSLASDGDDGNSSAAGAIADGMTVARAQDAGVDPVAALERNDSATVFQIVGGLVETGPTGTNVNDAYIAVRRRVFA